MKPRYAATGNKTKVYSNCCATLGSLRKIMAAVFFYFYVYTEQLVE